MMCPSGMRMPSGFVAIILFTHGLFDFKKSRCSRVRCRKIVYMFMCDSVCCSDDVYIFIV